MKISARSADVEFRDVTRRFGNVVAVDSISFTIASGTLVTLLGPSGCGKTTTLRMIAGLEIPSAGTIRIGGRDVTRLPATARDVSMVFQSYALFPHMNVIENVAYGLAVGGGSKAEQRDRARAGLELVGLAGYDARMPSELSGGQQQRVAVARALVLEPSVLLFDEPLSNLDAKLRRRMREEIRDLQQKLGLTAVYVTHDQEEALAVSDVIVVMSQARIAQSGSPAELYDQPATRFVADFIGGANLLPCEVGPHRDGVATCRLGPLAFDLPHRGIAAGGTTLAVRPHAIRLHTHPAADRLPARIRKATYLGSHIEFTLDSDVGELFAIASAGDGVQVSQGASVHASLGPGGLALVRD
jgi:iron(III) transport system ATP-binding protein